jgi:hypothetical protein
MALMSYRPNANHPNRRRAVAVARTVDWRAAAAVALTPVLSAGLWIALANAFGLFGH